MIILTDGGGAAKARKLQIGAWREALLKAKKAAEANKENKPRFYQIVYRIGKSGDKAAYPAHDRRSALVELLQSLAPTEMHLSTSCWLVKVHIQDTEDLSDLLSPPLDPEFDFLGVTQVSNVNRSEFGHARLES